MPSSVDQLLSHHHAKLMEAYEVHVKKWQALTSPVDEGEVREHGRCADCWLRTYDCYCTLEETTLSQRRQLYQHFNTVRSV